MIELVFESIAIKLTIIFLLLIIWERGLAKE